MASIQSAKTAKEMLEAVCEDLEQHAGYWRQMYIKHHGSATLADYAASQNVALRNRAAEYRAILKGME